ncbi:hypothetical protein BKA69DRAFT_202665 [Paraphysoderma sedebokerense]|nr:hypothetical protein BKA69DRAFT_202665 [Paraphysoderma sedebokerense]
MGDVRLWITDEDAYQSVTDEDIKDALKDAGWSKNNNLYDELYQSLKDIINKGDHVLPVIKIHQNVRIGVYPTRNSHRVPDDIDYREAEFKRNNVDRSTDANSESDRNAEEYVNSAVATYFQGNTLLTNYEYITKYGGKGEVDGVIVGKDEGGKNTIVFVETKRDMNKNYEDAKSQMLRTLDHWQHLKDVQEDPDLLSGRGTEQKDIENLKVKEYRDYNVRCAFGGEVIDHSIGGQLKNFKKYKPLKVVKDDDSSYQVKNLL